MLPARITRPLRFTLCTAMCCAAAAAAALCKPVQFYAAHLLVSCSDILLQHGVMNKRSTACMISTARQSKCCSLASKPVSLHQSRTSTAAQCSAGVYAVVHCVGFPASCEASSSVTEHCLSGTHCTTSGMAAANITTAQQHLHIDEQHNNNG